MTAPYISRRQLKYLLYSTFRIPMYVLYWVCHVDCKYIQWNYSRINDLRHMSPSHSIFCFSKNQSCLFIFFIKNPHFAWKWQLIFSLSDQNWKMKNGMNPTIEKKLYSYQVYSVYLDIGITYIYSTVIPLYIFTV